MHFYILLQNQTSQLTIVIKHYIYIKTDLYRNSFSQHENINKTHQHIF
jgi:hypothetical protein